MQYTLRDRKKVLCIALSLVQFNSICEKLSVTHLFRVTLIWYTDLIQNESLTHTSTSINYITLT